MVRLPSRIFFVFVCLLISAPVWAQIGPLAYVSTGPSLPSQIYSLNTSTGATTLLVSTNGADYEGLVVGPDNNSADNALANPIFNVVYACSTNSSTIVRFNAAATSLVANPEIIYQGGAALQHPQCGRITSSGDLIVTSKDSGADGGWWIFSGIAGKALGTGIQTPTQLESTPGSVDEGIALKNIGDLLIVDNANNRVFRSSATAAPPFSDDRVFISSNKGLSSPFGIARRSDGQIYVSNQNQGKKPFIDHFDASGNVVAACSSLGFSNNAALNMMQMSPGDTLFVAGATGSNSTSGALFQVDASPATGCLSLTKTFSPGLPPLFGVALALPNFSASRSICIPSTQNPPCDATANFGYAALEAINVSGNCNLTVTATPTSPAVLSGKIGTISPAVQAQPAVDFGWDGFETVVNPFAALPPGCAAASDGLFHYLLSVNVPSTVTNPLSIFCPTSGAMCESTLESVYPFGGPLPSDITSGGKKPGCTIFTANSTSPPAHSEPGTFCLYQPPINNTILNQPPSTLPAGNQVAVKFKLALASPPTLGNCQNGPYITDAQALLSIVQTADANGPVFVPMTIVVNGVQSPSFEKPNSGNSQQYTAKWDTSQCILPSGVSENCPIGTYVLTTVITSNNTAFQGSTDSIYTTQTTTIKIGKH